MEIWHHTERLDDWFKAVKQRREDRMNGRQEMDPIEDDVGSVRNEFLDDME